MSARPDAWTRQELAILADVYPREGINGAADALPDRSWRAIEQRAHKMGLKSPIFGDAPKLILEGEQLERAVHLYEIEGWPMMRIARELGFNEQATSNAVLIALCPRRGYRPAERDDTGRLLPEGKERLRYMLKKGLKHVEIQIRLGVSAATVARERLRYNADLVARGKATLPPPGAGEQYSGVKIPAKVRRVAEAAFLEGYGSVEASRRASISVPSAKNIRRRLVTRLARKGEALPGCDRDGHRMGAAKASRHYIPAEAADALRARLLAGQPVQPAARACGIGQCGAYRLRDQLKAELAARGKSLPQAKRLGRGDVALAARLETNWLPADRLQEFRTLVHQHGMEEAKRLLLARMDAERAADAAAIAAERARPKSFEEQLARLARGEVRVVANVKLRRPDPTGTLGGIATAAL